MKLFNIIPTTLNSNIIEFLNELLALVNLKYVLKLIKTKILLTMLELFGIFEASVVKNYFMVDTFSITALETLQLPT